MARKLIYVTTVKFNDGRQKKYATYTITDICDRLRLVYGVELNKARIFDELPAPSEIITKGQDTQRLKYISLCVRKAMNILAGILAGTVLVLTWRIIYLQYKIEDMEEAQEKEKAPRD